MNLSTQVTAIVMVFGATAVQAAPVTVFSTLGLDDSFAVNDGNLVDGLLFRSLGSSLEISRSANSGIDAPDVEESNNNFVQIGNPFTEPPLPFRSVRTDSTNLPGSPLEGAQGTHDISVNTRSDSDTGTVLERSLDNEGSASILFATDPINAAGVSSYALSRTFLIENTTDGILSFNVMGAFEAFLAADVTGDAGLAQTDLSYSLMFDRADGVGINYADPTPYASILEEDADGAFASQSMIADDDGLAFDAQAISDAAFGGGPASVSASLEYMFSIQMLAGASFTLTQSFSQRNEATIRLQDPLPPVPLPASGLMLVAGLFGLISLRRRAAA